MPKKAPQPDVTAVPSGRSTTVSDAIETRRSIREFLPEKPVSEQLLKGIVQRASRAASGGNIQPWKV